MAYGLHSSSTSPPLLLVLFSSVASFSISNRQSVKFSVLFIFTVTGSLYFFICYCHCVWFFLGCLSLFFVIRLLLTPLLFVVVFLDPCWI
jgi:hypothetical protein